jgi:hypothetical protein
MRIDPKVTAVLAERTRSKTLNRTRFASQLKCKASLTTGVRFLFERDPLSGPPHQARPPAELRSASRKATSAARKCGPTPLQDLDLYGFPTVARGRSQECFVTDPNRFTPARSRILRALPLAREAIP